MSTEQATTTTTRPTLLHRMFSIASMAKAVAALILAIGLATTAAGGTYALWNSSATVVASTPIKSGTAALTLASGLAMPNTQLYPGITVYGSAVFKNDGDIPLTLRVASLSAPTASNAFSSALAMSVGRAASAADCSAGSITNAVTVAFGSSLAAPIGAAVAPAQTGVVCVAATLPSTAPNGGQGLSASNFALTIDGAQT